MRVRTRPIPILCFMNRLLVILYHCNYIFRLLLIQRIQIPGNWLGKKMMMMMKTNKMNELISDSILQDSTHNDPHWSEWHNNNLFCFSFLLAGEPGFAGLLSNPPKCPVKLSLSLNKVPSGRRWCRGWGQSDWNTWRGWGGRDCLVLQNNPIKCDPLI